MFKRYGPRHWGLFIPVGFRTHRVSVWHADSDMVVIGTCRKNLIITLKLDTFCGNFFEFRLRVGAQYLSA